MSRLSYSPSAVLKHFVFALIATPPILALLFNQKIADGHVFGIFVGTLYLIGLVGRWAVAIALIGIVWFSCIRLLLILLGGGTAVATASTGVTVQRVMGRQEFDWNELIAIESIIKGSRNRSFRYLRVRAIRGSIERCLDIPASILSATDDELESWVLDARRAQLEARSSRQTGSGTVALSMASPRNGFGRKRDL